MAAATLKGVKKVDAANKMTEYGKKLNESLVNAAEQSGFNLIASGIPAMPYYRLDGVDTKTHFKWIDECVKRGVIWWVIITILFQYHSDEDIESITDIARQAFSAL